METFDEQIRNAGEIDAMLIGLGFDGHFCSNCPRFSTPMDSYTYALERKIKNAVNPAYADKTPTTGNFNNGSKEFDASKTPSNDCHR